MRLRAYLTITGIIFALVSLLHLARLVFAWTFQIGPLVLPFWISWGGFLVPGILAVWGLRLSCSKPSGSDSKSA